VSASRLGRIEALTAVWLLVANLAGLACAGGPERLRLANPDETLATDAAWRAALGEAQPVSAPSSPALVVGASSREVIAARLDRNLRDADKWHVEAPVTAGPVLASERVFFSSGRDVRVLAADDGQARGSLAAPGMLLLAAAVRGGSTALLLADPRGQRTLSVYDAQSRERLRVSADGPLGAPAFFGDVLLVPWANGYLSAVDVSGARERARVRVGESLVHALSLGGALFFGGPPWVEPANPGAASYSLPRRPLPEPIDAGPLATTPGAAEPTRLVVEPQAAAGSIYMATFGRVAFGLEQEHGALVWVTALPGRALAAVAVTAGFLVCDESGSVRWLSERTGRVERSWQLVRQRRITLGDKTLIGCALSPGLLLPAERARRGESAEPTLLEQLTRVLGLADPELTEAQRFLSRELAARPEPEATRVLLELVTRNSLDRRLQAEAEDLLATRRNGEEFMLEALSPRQAPGQNAVALPPIAPLGEALAALGERRAAPLLARQLNRPAHSAAAVARAAAALEQLASEAEYAELSVFFSLHRTTADEPEWVAAVVSSARTLLRIGGEKARTLLAIAQRDPLTVSAVRSGIERELGVAPGAPIRRPSPTG
jgi:outer membrane protein assembly factor BamB